MKKTRIALAIATAAMASTPVLATNGDNLIGLGAQSRAMGGTGTAAFMGSENALTNPGLLGKSEGTEFAIGGTLFKPSVKANTTVASAPGSEAEKTSANDTNIIPEVSLSTRLSDNLTFGLGIFGSAGMGVDYREDNVAASTGTSNNGNDMFNAYSNLQIMKFAPTLAYNTSKFGIGFAPVIQYGALDINYTKDSDNNAANGNDNAKNVGTGMSSDIGMGFNLGGYFNITTDLTLGLAYQSAIDMKYKNQITGAAEGLNVTGLTDHLEQPAEIKVGVAYDMGSFMLTADAKQIQWGDAKGYKDFNWKNQNVFAVGGKYQGNGYWLGAGANYGDDPIEKLADTSYRNQAINMFNNHFFPGIVTTHFTFGGGYQLTKNMALDGAVVYAPEVNKTVNTGFASGQANPSATYHKVTHSQMGYTVSLRMNF